MKYLFYSIFTSDSKILVNIILFIFPLHSQKSAQDEGTERDEKALFGYAMLTLNN